nr:ribonuclease H-like domain-containing protein [Tanacetum cinerariifolium]
MADAKEMWEAIKSRFGVNDKSKKMHKYLLKQQFEGFSVSSSEGLHKGYDSTNDVSTVYSVSSPSVSKSQKEGSASYTDEVIHSFFANQSSAPQLDCNDLEQINDDDLEEMDLKWDTVGFDKTKVECLNYHKMRHFAKDCRAKENQDSRRRDGGYNENTARDNGRRPAYQDNLKSLVTIDEEAIDVLVLEESKTAQDLVIKKLQKKVKRIERKIKARTPGMTLFKIGNFRRKSLDKKNVSKQRRYLKTMLMFEESDFDNIDDMVDEDND